MTPPRRRASDEAEPRDPVEAMRAQLDRIELHVAGGLDDQGRPVRGLHDRVASLESLVRWVAGLGTIALGAVGAAWAMLFGGPHQPTGH